MKRPIIAVYDGWFYRWDYFTEEWHVMMANNINDAVCLAAGILDASPHTVLVYYGKDVKTFIPDYIAPHASCENCSRCGIKLHESDSYATPANAMNTVYYCETCGKLIEENGIAMDWIKT